MRTAFLLAAALLLAGPALAQKYPADFPVDTTISGNENIHHQENHSGSYTSYNLPFRFVKRYMSPNVAASPIAFYPDTAGIGTKYNYLGKFVTAPDSSAWYIDGTGQAMYLGIPALSFSNGLTNNGPMVGLGGMLEEPTYIYVTPGSPLVLQDTSGVASAIFGSNAVSLFSEKGDTVAYMSAYDGKVDMHGGEDAQVGIQVSENQMEAWDDRGTKRGLQYRADYSGDLKASPRSIPDVGTVQELIADSLNILWDSIALLNMQLEASADSISKLQLAMGIPAGASSLGSFDGETIPDGSSGKQAFQSLETAHEATAASLAVIANALSDSTDSRIANRRSEYFILDELHCQNSAVAATMIGDYNAMTSVAVNGGAVVLPSLSASIDSIQNHPSVLEYQTGTTNNNTGYSGNWGVGYKYAIPASTSIGNDCIFEYLIQTGTNSFGNTAIGSSIFVGLAINVPNSSFASQNVLGFYSNSGTDDYWSIIADSAGVESGTNIKLTSIATAQNQKWYNLRIWFDSETRSVNFYINGQLVSSISNNIPTVTVYPVVSIAKVATTTTSASLFYDYLYLYKQIDRR